MKGSSLISLGLLPVLSVNAAYTWPSEYDQLEDILYLQQGFIRFGLRDGKLSERMFQTGIENNLFTNYRIRCYAVLFLIGWRWSSGGCGMDKNCLS